MVAPEIWGHAFWKTIHAVALGYSEGPPERLACPDVRAGYLAWFKSLAHVLPCDMCRVNYKDHLADADFINTLARSLEEDAPPGALFEWTIQLRNRVQAIQGRTAITGAEAMRDLYESPGVHSDWNSLLDVGLVHHGVALSIGIIIAAIVVLGLYVGWGRLTLMLRSAKSVRG